MTIDTLTCPYQHYELVAYFKDCKGMTDEDIAEVTSDGKLESEMSDNDWRDFYSYIK